MPRALPTTDRGTATPRGAGQAIDKAAMCSGAMDAGRPVEFARRTDWVGKFRHAFRGAKRGIRGQSSFFVHFFFAALVVAGAMALGATLLEWCLLLLCIAGVLSAEMFNTALERLARAISREYHPDIGAALDISSAAVLVATLGAVVVGTIVLGNRLGLLLGWW
jgi:diacylglycerol kinase